ncbi:polyol/monosaccharide transporter 5 [Perilla frutescens var. frutescens]|nr:polyol/monosaccharide transporter 5 [Perilla frutescens var. frutescens]
MLGIGVVPSVFIAIGVLTMPDSPCWLVMQSRLGDAKRVLDKTSNSLQESKLRLSDIKEAAGIPGDYNNDVVAVPKQYHGEGVWCELLFYRTLAVRHILMCTVGIHLFQQSSGIDSVVLYNLKIFKRAGIQSDMNKLLAIMVVRFVKTLVILVASFLMDKIGRRPLLLSSVAGMILSLLAGNCAHDH